MDGKYDLFDHLRKTRMEALEGEISALPASGFDIDVRSKPAGLTRTRIRITIQKRRDAGRGGSDTP